MFYDQFHRLCQAKGVTPTQVARDLGLRQSTVSMWKKQGTTPKYDTLRKLADYFSVNVDDLLVENWGIKAGGKIKAGGGIKSRYGIEAGGGIETGGPIEVGPVVYGESDYSIRVHVSPEQREYGELMKKCADGTITDAELRRLSELRAKQPPLEESLKRLTGTLERMKEYLAPLNDVGQMKVIRYAEDYAKDLAKVPEYRTETAPQSPPAPQEGKDTTPPSDVPETPLEGE